MEASAVLQQLERGRLFLGGGKARSEIHFLGGSVACKNWKEAMGFSDAASVHQILNYPYGIINREGGGDAPHCLRNPSAFGGGGSRNLAVDQEGSPKQL